MLEEAPWGRRPETGGNFMASLLRRSALATLMAMVLLLVAAPAFAHHGPSHTGGSPSVSGSHANSNSNSSANSNVSSGSSSTVVNEDTDSDGFANTPDPA